MVGSDDRGDGYGRILPLGEDVREERRAVLLERVLETSGDDYADVDDSVRIGRFFSGRSHCSSTSSSRRFLR